MKPKKKYWYALYTKPRWEKKIARLLADKGIEHYCPLNRVEKRWSDRKKVIHEPVFKSYVFVRLADENRWAVKSIDGVVNFVYWLGKPAVIRDEEIDTIRKFLNEFDDVQVEAQDELRISSRVRVRKGLMMNYQGMLIELSGNKAKVRIDSLGMSLYAYFDKKNLEVISN